MATFVLVHGGLHGGWCWKRVAERLRAQGHDVYTPTLTGLGERSHLLNPSIDVDTHVADILGVLEWEDLHDVILVSHSYGGLPTTGAAARAPARIAHRIYLDALRPEDGESAEHLSGANVDQREVAKQGSEGPQPLDVSLEFARMMGISDPDDLEWVRSKVTAQPPATVTQPLEMREPPPSPILYIGCLDQRLAPLDPSFERAKARAASGDPLIRVVELDAPHDAMVTHPDQVAELLLSVL